MPSHQVTLLSTTNLTPPPHKRPRHQRNQSSNTSSTLSLSRLDIYDQNNSNCSGLSQSDNLMSTSTSTILISKNDLTHQDWNDLMAGQSAKRCSFDPNSLLACPSVAPAMEENKTTRARSISNPLPKLCQHQKSRDSLSRSDIRVSLSNKNLPQVNNQACPSYSLTIPTISITTSNTQSIVSSNGLSIKGNNILSRLLRKSKESKMEKKHHTKSSPTNHQHLTIDGSLVTLKNKHSSTSATLSSFKSFSSTVSSGVHHSNHSLSNISCYSTESNVTPFNNESSNDNDSRGELSSKDSQIESPTSNTELCENQEQMISDKGTMRETSSLIDQEGDKNNQRLDEKKNKTNNGEKMTANATCQIDPTTIVCLTGLHHEDCTSSPMSSDNNNNTQNLKFIRRLSSTLSQLSKPKRQKIKNSTDLSDCPQEIILHISSFILCTTSHTQSGLFAECSILPSNIGSFSPSSITPVDSSNSGTMTRRNSSSTMRRIGHYPKYTSFPAELTRDYFNLMLISKTFHSALEFDSDNEDQFKQSIVEGFWKYMLLWQYVYPNFSTIDKLDEYMRDLECRKSLNTSYKRLYSYVNSQSLQQKVVIPKKKNVVYDPSNYFYLLVAGVNFLVVQTIRALFFESKSDFECKSIKFNKEEFKVKVESCSFMDYSLAPNCAEYKFRGTDGVIFVAYMSSRSSLDAMIKYIEKCIEFRKKDEQRTTMDPPAAIILGTITKNTTIHEISLTDLLEVKKTYSYFIKDVIIVNTDTLENIQSSFEKISAMMYRSRVKTYVKTLPIIDEALKKDDTTLSQELKRRKNKLQNPTRKKKCTIM